MNEYPIPFSELMVRAILDGRKTMTRRVVKPQPGNFFESFGELPTCTCCPYGFHDGENHYQFPWGQPGAKLWVQEEWAEKAVVGWSSAHGEQDAEWYIYKSDYIPRKDENIKWQSIKSMPRDAARLVLEVVHVHVERLQEISATDIEREGAITENIEINKVLPIWINLWNSIYTKLEYQWENNPWVWVIEFKKVAKF